jgi:hypothetical protein
MIGALALSGTLQGEDALQEFRTETTNAQASPTLSTGAGNTPTNRDFLSLFIAALESYSDSGGEAITLDYNLPNSVFGAALASKAQIVLRKPALAELLAKKYAEKAAVVEALESQLNYGDDVTLTFAISPQAKQGEANVREAFRAAARPLMQTRRVEIQQERAAARAEVSRELARDRGEARDGREAVAVRSDGFAVLDAALRRESTRSRAEITPDPNAPVSSPPDNGADTPADDVTVDLSLDEQAAKTLIEDVAALAANQSKFTLDASYRDRHDFVGADEWGVKVAYEYGPGTSVGKRVDAAESKCAESYARAEAMSAEAAGCENTYEAALREAINDPKVAMGSRFTFALEYKDKSGVNIDSVLDLDPADETVTFKSEGARSVIGSVAAGWDVYVLNQTENKRDHSGRFEVSLSYDNVSDDKDRNDRFIGKLTYSQRINEKLYLPISISYANHAEYLGEVDHKLNAHFGIAYKLPNLK